MTHAITTLHLPAYSHIVTIYHSILLAAITLQTNMEEALGSMSKLKGSPDLLTFGCFLIYKLTTLQLMVNKVFRYYCTVLV